MRYLYILIVLITISSCNSQPTTIRNFSEENPELIGTWLGTGKFLDIKTNQRIGEIPINITLSEDNKIIGTIGDANLVNATLKKASRGFDIYAELSSKLNEKDNLDKGKIIILLVKPETTEPFEKSDANFHIKSNFTFDISMRVGGVILQKQ